MIHQDSVEMARKCERCQKHAPTVIRLSEKLSSVVLPGPFMKLGMDIMGHLPMVSAHKRFMLALTDYYSKWIAAEAYAGIKDKDV